MLKVAVVLFDGVEELDFTGPYQIFGNVAEVFTVGPYPTVRTRHGLKVNADLTFETAPKPEVLVVPGGPDTRENPGALAPVATYIRRVASSCRIILAVSTGTFILGSAGMLEGRNCTTHYRHRHLLMARHPDAEVHYTRVVNDGKIISTSGGAAGIDGALFAVSRLYGLEQAKKLAKKTEYPWHTSQITHGSHAGEVEFVLEQPAIF